MSEELDAMLMQAAKIAEAEGTSLVAYTVEPNGDGTMTSTLQKPSSSFAIRMVHLAAQARGNVDSFMIALIKHAREHGPGGSMFLHRELSRD